MHDREQQGLCALEVGAGRVVLGVPGLVLVLKVSNFRTVCDVLVRVTDQRRDEQGRVLLQGLGPGE